jgi:Rhodopirellula transposase DDE domain
MQADPILQQKYKRLFPYLDERQRRLVAAEDARVLGYGGIARVARAAGLSRPTLHHALTELGAKPVAVHRVRRAGGGRKPLCDTDPALVGALEALMDPTTRGDPMAPLRWTCKSTRHLAAELTSQGHPISHQGVAEVLRGLGYSLQAHRKTLEGTQHPDRDAQFHYLNRTTQAFRAQGGPVIWVDTKKKELVGNYRNGGREGQPQGRPEKGLVQDFPHPRLGRAIPYGVYDSGENLGWVNVGCDHDTASFAVQSIRRWWDKMGARRYPRADQLLICADSGGSHGYRVRLWKVGLQQFATETGLTVTVCHFPPGTSKWNKIEHRLFSHITMNWRGRPLISYEVIVNLISATATKTGLRVRAALDRKQSPSGQKVSDAVRQTLHLEPHAFQGEWNYTLKPEI